MARCSKHPVYHEPCKICAEISRLEEEVEQLKERKLLEEESSLRWKNKVVEIEADLDEALETINKLSNIANKHYNPEAKLRLSANDMLMVRGIFTANTFLYNSLVSIDDCISKKKDETTKEQFTLIKRDLKLEWNRIADLLAMFMKEFSQTNWNRMLREVQKIADVSAKTMNSRDLGFFMVTKEGEYISQEYKVRPKVEAAVKNCISSAGTNSITAYSKELLIKELVKICEEK